MIGVVIVLTFTFAYKIIYKTKIRDPKTADLRTGRRTLGKEEIDMLNEYYGRSTIKRFWTYVQLW
jgi:amino acid transporter